MKTHKLFPKVDALLHGGDYNPEQWLDRPDILEEDVWLMKEAGVNTVTLGVFSWSVYEPREGEYHFEWLHKILDTLYENGIYTVMATPSGARPAWLDETYPEALRMNLKRVRNLHGVRHNHCITSPKYRQLVHDMDVRLAKEVGSHPGIILWHISNEFGGECACPLCEKKFQDWLRNRYDNDIDKLNHAWWTTFWSHRYNDFSQINAPAAHGEQSIHGLNLDWKRFTTDNTREFMEAEMAVFRELTPDIPITTNFMHMYSALDYNKLSKPLDVISWDSYPRYGNPEESLYDTSMENALDHVMMRSFKHDRPFMMMESVPSLVNWHEYNKAKRPGVHKVTALQAIACGSDTVQYFQWRKSRGSFEQFHGAVLDHLGRSDTRVFRDVAEVGRLLKALKPVQGSIVESKAAILFDWDNRWALEDCAAFSKLTKQYTKTCLDMFKLFQKNGVDVDVIAPTEDFSGYRLLAIPMMYLMKPGVADRLKAFVSAGGQVVMTYISGYVDESTLCYLGGFPGDGLTELFGLYVEETDTLYPQDVNGVRFTGLPGVSEDTVFAARDYCDVIKVQGADTAAVYTEDFYAGEPAVTVNGYGQGKAWYVGARVEQAAMEQVLLAAMREADIPVKDLPEGVEYHRRSGDDAVFDFYLNYTTEPVTVETEPGVDLISGRSVSGQVKLEGLGVMVCQVQP